MSEPSWRAASILLEDSGLVHGFQRRDPESGATREDNRRRVSQSLEAFGRLSFLSQVHGARVIRAPFGGSPAADAAWTERAGCLLGIETADCLPVLLADPSRRVVAAAHAGWRGTVASVAVRSARQLVADGSRASDLVAAIGPGIGVCCYQVGPDVVEAFGAAAAGLFEEREEGRYLDLRVANRRQLESVGVAPERIEDVDECTACHPGFYHSFRRDGAASGRMISYIGWREARR
jgi:YfiH family protein